MKETQKQIVKESILKNGFVTRNWALRRNITRLASIIVKLNNEGMSIGKGETRVTEYGENDCKYSLEVTKVKKDCEHKNTTTSVYYNPKEGKAHKSIMCSDCNEKL